MYRTNENLHWSQSRFTVNTSKHYHRTKLLGRCLGLGLGLGQWRHTINRKWYLGKKYHNSVDPLKLSVFFGVNKAHFDKGIQIQHIFAYDSSFILITGYRSFNFCTATFTCRDVHDIWRDHGANEPHAYGEHVPDSLLTRHARQLP